MQKSFFPELFLFTASLFVRVGFKCYTGFNNYELFEDSYRYRELAARILKGNLDLDTTAYITAPLYPYYLALMEFLTGASWELWVVMGQFVLVSISAVYIYKLANLLFPVTQPGMTAGIMYILWPMTMWYNFTLVQETMFQVWFIMFLYYFYKYCTRPESSTLFAAAMWFALALLTKSHILLLLPFVLIIITRLRNIKSAMLFGMVLITFNLPFALINVQHHGVFTLGSYGSGSLFLLGNSELGYRCLLNQTGTMGKLHSEGCNPDIIFDLNYIYKDVGPVNQQPWPERNWSRYAFALEWIHHNPLEFLRLKWHGIYRFIMPGLDDRQYRKSIWMGSLLLGLLLYVPAYIKLFSRPHTGSLKYFVQLSIAILLLLAILFIIFLPMQRLRAITLEPLLILFAAPFYHTMVKKAAPLIHQNPAKD